MGGAGCYLYPISLLIYDDHMAVLSPKERFLLVVVVCLDELKVITHSQWEAYMVLVISG